MNLENPYNTINPSAHDEDENDTKRQSNMSLDGKMMDRHFGSMYPEYTSIFKKNVMDSYNVRSNARE